MGKARTLHKQIIIINQFLEFLRHLYHRLFRDILIYSKTQGEPWLHEFGPYDKFAKCNFGNNQVDFLGYMVPLEDISMDTAKQFLSGRHNVLLHDVKCFLEFSNFYH